MRWVPPAAEISPRRDSGRPMRALPRAITLKSHDIASSHPAPSACPPMAARVSTMTVATSHAR